MLITKKFLQGVLVILITITPFFILAQDSLHIAKGDEYFAKFLKFHGFNQDSVLHYLKQSIKEYRKGEAWNKYIEALNGLSTLYANIDDYESYVKYSNLALQESKKYLKKTDVMYSITLGNHAYSLVYKGNYKDAILQFKDGLVIERLHDEVDYISSSLKNIGDLYNEIGDLDVALKYYNEWLAFNKSNLEDVSINRLVNVYRRMGLAYYRKKEYDKGLIYLRKARLTIAENPGKSNYLQYTSSININYDIARIYLDKNNFDSLIMWTNKSLQLGVGEFKNSREQAYRLIGRYHLKQGEYKKALDNLLKAKKYNDNLHKDFIKHKSFSKIDNLLAKVYLKMQMPDKAISLFRKSIINLKSVSKASVENNIAVPTIENITDPTSAIEAFSGLGEGYIALHKTSKNQKHLEASYLCYDRSSHLIPEIRNSLQEESSLLRYSEIAIPIYERCISLALKMNEQTNDESFLKQAFQYNEMSKAILLLESINKSSAIQFANIPDSLLQKEKVLKLQMSNINRKLYEEENVISSQDSFKIDKLKRQLFIDAEEYDALIRKFEKEYADYYNLKFRTSDIKVEDIQNKLNQSGTQLIEYFYGNDNIYVFSLTEDDISINTIPIYSSLSDDIQILKDFLSIPPTGNNIKSEMENYIRTSIEIYEKILKNSIHPKSKHLVLITDGILGYLPFEALVTRAPNSNEVSFSLKNQSYLIEDYNISYSYSSTLFLNSFNAQENETDNTFLGVAPSFNLLNDKGSSRICNDNALYSLQCSEEEVMQIKSKIGGKVLLQDEATLQSTLNEISKSKIIHLATHACLDDSNPEFNKIYLADDYLSNNELYNLKLNSELAVLSACETGSGKLAKGEGVMSLARGFIHAGCPSIVMSLWSIDDCATSKIMVDFYDELLSGRSKSNALRNSKLNYIKEAKRANQHPYYWAAFVQIGNYDPMELDTFKFRYIIPFILIGMVLFFFWRKLHRRFKG